MVFFMLLFGGWRAGERWREQRRAGVSDGTACSSTEEGGAGLMGGGFGLSQVKIRKELQLEVLQMWYFPFLNEAALGRERQGVRIHLLAKEWGRSIPVEVRLDELVWTWLYTNPLLWPGLVIGTWPITLALANALSFSAKIVSSLTVTGIQIFAV